nr:unnamed protein product [Digitaria exilis]
MTELDGLTRRAATCTGGGGFLPARGGADAPYREGGRLVGRNGAAGAGIAGGNLTEVLPVPVAVVLRTVTPAHFENGEWNTGGDCVRTLPFRRGERTLGAVEAEYRAAQVDALRETEAAAPRNGVEMLLLDITEAMDLRMLDGHPSRYGHPLGGSVEGSFVVAGGLPALVLGGADRHVERAADRPSIVSIDLGNAECTERR